MSPAVGGDGGGGAPLTQLSGPALLASAVAMLQHSGASASAFVINCHALQPAVEAQTSQHAAWDAACGEPAWYLLMVSLPWPLMHRFAVGHGHCAGAPGIASRLPQTVPQSVAVVLQPVERSSSCCARPQQMRQSSALAHCLASAAAHASGNTLPALP